MKQRDLDLAGFGMSIACVQLKAMAAVAKGFNRLDVAAQFEAQEKELAELCERIANGTIKGSEYQ